MSLSQEERKAVVDYRLEKAESTFIETQKVSTLDLWNNAANRLYYSLYYAATALLIADQHQCHTHSGMLTLMNLFKFLHFNNDRLWAKIDTMLWHQGHIG